MSARPVFPRPARRPRRAGKRLLIEALEPRNLPAVTSWPGGTLDVALPLGSISASAVGPSSPQHPDYPGRYAEAAGTIGHGPAGAADVTWFRFRLTAAADVTVTTPPRASPNPVTPVVTLYNDAPLNIVDATQNDPYTPTGHRLLGQNDGAAHGGVATVERVLGPGTYFVAVSGTGNHDFHPLIPDSGVPGGTGDYDLLVTANPLAAAPTGPGPSVIAATPGDGADLTGSPFAVRLTLDSPLDPGTVEPMTNVVLLDGGGNPVPLQKNDGVSFFDPTNGALFSAAASELEVFPEAPLAPGDYRLLLVGDAAANHGADVLRGTNGEALGSTSPHGPGHDYTLTFHVTGVEGVRGMPAADDTFDHAHALGDLSSGGFVQARGSIGDDPFAPGAANDVDLYRFQISGPGNYATVATVDAGRIGSPLDPALALYKIVDGKAVFFASNNDTGNQSQATDRSTPLAKDSAIFAGLSQGDYVLAVASAGNVPDPSIGLPPGTPGLLDPNPGHSHGALNGTTTGDYLLSLAVRPDNTPPHVIAVGGLSSGTPGAPTFFTVQFDKEVNLQQLGFAQDPPPGTGDPSQPGSLGFLGPVFVRGSDGLNYHPRLVSYDAATNTATFLMLDALPAGPSVLHLSGAGAGGLADMAGNPLAGPDGSADYLYDFTVAAPPRVTFPETGNVTWLAQGWNTSRLAPRVIGPLFAREMAGDRGVDLLGTVTHPGGADPSDYYQIEVTQYRDYLFTLTDRVTPPGDLPTPTGTRVRIFTPGPDGQEITTNSGNPFVFDFPLRAGTYVVQVGPVDATRASDLAYRLRITLGTSYESAVPLTVGAAPPYAIAVQRAGTPSAPSSAASSGARVAPPAALLTLPSAPAPGGGGVPATAPPSSSAPGGAPALLSLPPSALAALSAPPVGGVRGSDVSPAPTAADRLVLPGLPSSSSAEGGVRLASLGTASLGREAVSSGPGDPGRVISHFWRVLDEVGGAAVDGVFRSGAVAEWLSSWLRGLWVPFAWPAVPAPGAELDPTPGADGGPPDQAPDAPDEAASGPAEAADWLWAGGLLAAGGLAVRPLARRRCGELHEQRHRRR